MLGTYVEVGVESSPYAESALTAAYRTIEDLHRRLSFQDPASELSHLNRSGGEWVALSPCTLRVLRLARATMRASKGCFDFTLGETLVRQGHLPRHRGTLDAMASGSAEDLELMPGRARLRRPIQITLDGIAKGYAVDRAVTALRAEGARAGWVNAGGDLRAFGPMTLALHRRESSGRLYPLGGLRDAALATSATGDRAELGYSPGPVLAVGGKAVAPGTWTVTSAKAWRADALTKVAAATDPVLRAERIARLGGRYLDSILAVTTIQIRTAA